MTDSVSVPSRGMSGFLHSTSAGIQIWNGRFPSPPKAWGVSYATEVGD